MSSVSPTHEDLSNDTTFSQIKSRVPVPLNDPALKMQNFIFARFFASSFFVILFQLSERK